MVTGRFHGFRDELAEAVPEATVRSVLLGSHDAPVDRRLQVGSRTGLARQSGLGLIGSLALTATLLSTTSSRV